MLQGKLKNWLLAGRSARCRRGSAPSEVHSDRPISELQNFVEPQRALVALIKDASTQIEECMRIFQSVQCSIMAGVEEYLGFDLDGIDEAALSLAELCAVAFERCHGVLDNCEFQGVIATCDRVLQECEFLQSSAQSLNAASGELHHYEEKVAGLCADTGPGGWRKSAEGRLWRNEDKLLSARTAAEAKRDNYEIELRAFFCQRVARSRATVHGFLRAYVCTLASLGRHTASLADNYAEELRPGTDVQLLGVKDSQCGKTEGFQEGTGRCCVLLADGSHVSVPLEGFFPVRAFCDDAAPSAAAVVVQPARAPCDICCEVEIRCHRSLDGPLAEVLIGQTRAEVLESTSCWARVRLPPGAVHAFETSARVEVRAVGWQQRVASAEFAFRHFAPVGFGPCGSSVCLASADGAPLDRAPAIVSRLPDKQEPGWLHCVALSASPLSNSSISPLEQRYFFEVKVREASDKRTGTARAVSLGFHWPSPADPTHALPERACELRRAFVVGGDRPRAHLGGSEVSEVVGWRPLLDVGTGTVLGALLDATSLTLRLTVFQEGSVRCTVEVPRPTDWLEAPHGVVDVCGSVRSIEFQHGPAPPQGQTEVG